MSSLVDAEGLGSEVDRQQVPLEGVGHAAGIAAVWAETARQGGFERVISVAKYILTGRKPDDAETIQMEVGPTSKVVLGTGELAARRSRKK